MALTGKDFSKTGDTYTAEASRINFRYAADNITVQNLEGKDRTFEQTGADRDGSNEDIYGWNYREVGGNLKLLIIND